MDENKPIRQAQSQPSEWYSEVATAIEGIGFFTSGLEQMDEGWNRTTIASKRSANGLGGNSFWLTVMPAGCYLGTWGGIIYRFPNRERLTELCAEWFELHPNECRSHFDDQLAERFGLETVGDAEFDRLVR